MLPSPELLRQVLQQRNHNNFHHDLTFPELLNLEISCSFHCQPQQLHKCISSWHCHSPATQALLSLGLFFGTIRFSTR